MAGLVCTQAEHDALSDAIKSGALVVRYADKTVEYRSLTDMLRTLSLMAEYLLGTSAPGRVAVATFAKG